MSRYKTDPGTVKMERVTLTPTIARQWLESMVKNRPIRKRIVAAYATEMRHGHWLENGETFKFSTEKNLLDGQHRCAAVIESGVSIPAWVASGLDQVAFDTVDRGISRSLADVFSTHGIANATTVSSACRWYWVLSERPNHFPGTRAEPHKMLEVLENTPFIQKAALQIKRWGYFELWAPAVATALYTLFHEKNVAMSEMFMGKLGTGEMLTRGEGLWQLRRILINNVNSMGGMRWDRLALVGMTIKCWNHYRDGTPNLRVKWTRGEEVPQPK